MKKSYEAPQFDTVLFAKEDIRMDNFESGAINNADAKDNDSAWIWGELS